MFSCIMETVVNFPTSTWLVRALIYGTENCHEITGDAFVNPLKIAVRFPRLFPEYVSLILDLVRETEK